MFKHLFHSGPHFRRSSEQSFNQIFETWWKGLAFSLKKRPKLGEPALADQIVLLIADFCVFKGRYADKHEEEHDSGSEKVDFFSSVISIVYFRGHISFCSFPRLEVEIVIVAEWVSGEAKICQFKVEPFIEEDVFQLDVSMSDIQVLQVLDCFRKLNEESSADVLGKFLQVD